MYGGGVMLGHRAGSGVGKYIVESPKQDSERFNSGMKTIHFGPSRYIIYLKLYTSSPSSISPLWGHWWSTGRVALQSTILSLLIMFLQLFDLKRVQNANG